MTSPPDDAPPAMIPIFPLPVVLFPGMKLPLVVFESHYIEMIQEITACNAEMGVTLYLETQMENVAVATSVGTMARVLAVDAHTEGRLAILVEGVRRFKITRIDSESKPYLLAEVAPYEDEAPQTPAALREELLAAFRHMLSLYAQTQAARRDADQDPDRERDQSDPDSADAALGPERDPETDPDADALAASFSGPLSEAFEQALENVMEDLGDFESIDFSGLSDADLTYRVGEFLNHDETIQQKLLEMRACEERMNEEKTHLEALTRRLALMRQINDVFRKPSGDESAS
ncbi:MAG: LON peptidase substrate-binding domain-containing protein [Vampirovibrionales bacterium]|nr:LON peptidase substrate-binding domain-containing protein [Vampirovibrionales bacterium]